MKPNMMVSRMMSALSLGWLGIWSLASTACADPSVGVLVGQTPFEHAGLRVAGSGRLASSSPDSVWSVFVGSSAIRVSKPGGFAGTIALPAGASSAFGVAATIVHNYASSQFDALVIGDPGFNQARGRVFVYLGAAAFGGSPSLTIDGQTAGDLFGAAVADVGDVNGDGFGDFAVGAPGRTSGAGSLKLYRGGASPTGAPAVTLNGGASGDAFGSAVAGVGDLDQDAFADYVVGSPGAGGVGSATLVHGSVSFAASRIQTLGDPGAVPVYPDRPRFGSAIAGGRDLDGDGRADFIVGAPGTLGGRGAAYFFKGQAGVINAAGQEVLGASASDGFGTSLAVGSFVGPSSSDLAVGSPGASEGRGAISMFHGGAGFDLNADDAASGTSPDDALGSSLAAGRLFREAPASQLLIGAPGGGDDVADNAGAAYFFAAPPALAVQSVGLTVESDGSPLIPNSFTSTHPRFSLRLPGASSLDVDHAEVALDDRPVTVTVEASAGGGVSAAATLQPTNLAEGRHVLRARLYDTTHSLLGNAEIAFNVAARLRIEASRVVPNPTHGATRLVFTLTRPATIELDVFDVSGRSMFRRDPQIGIAAENALAIGARFPEGVYYYLLRASYQGEVDRVRGRLIVLH